MQVQLGNPVAVKEVENVGNIKLWDCWLSCWVKLGMDGRNQMVLIGQYPDIPGGYRPPGQSVVSSCSDEVKIKGYWGCAVVDRFVHIIPLRCFGALVAGMSVTASAEDVIQMTVLPHLGGGFLGRSVRLPQVSQWAGLRTPPMRAHWHTVVFFRRIRIPYKCPAFAGRDLLDTKPVNGSLHFADFGCRLADFIADGLVLCASRDSAEFLLAIVCRALLILLWHCSDTEMATGGDRPTDGRSGVNFDVELQVRWNAPEAYVNLDTDTVYELQTVPDILGLHSRWRVCALVPVPRVNDGVFMQKR